MRECWQIMRQMENLQCKQGLSASKKQDTFESKKGATRADWRKVYGMCTIHHILKNLIWKIRRN